MIYPANIEQKIDFTVLRDELHRRCSSSLGRERVDAMQMQTDYNEVCRDKQERRFHGIVYLTVDSDRHRAAAVQIPQ